MTSTTSELFGLLGLGDMEGIDGQHEAWSRTLQDILDVRIVESGTTQFYSPIGSARPEGREVERTAIWSAFPQALVNLYGPERALEVADDALGWTTLGVTAGGAPFVAPYRNQTEYCEWKVKRDAAGNLQNVTFTCEVVEYWWSLAQGYPPVAWNGPSLPRPPATGNIDDVLDYYQRHVNRSIRLADLLFREDIYDPSDTRRMLFSRHDYNPWNTWNTSEGLVHLTMPGNALSALLWLCTLATVSRSFGVDGGRSNGPAARAPVLQLQGRRHSTRRVAETAEPSRPPLTNHLRVLSALGDNAGINNLTDRSIVGVLGPLARAGMRITVDRVPHVQMLQLDTETWRVPGGRDPQAYWNITRGDSTKKVGVRGEFSVPPDAGFTIGDITIDGVPIRYGGQIAQCLNLGFKFWAHGEGSTSAANSTNIGGEPAVSASGRLGTLRAEDPRDDPRYRKLYPVPPKPVVEPIVDDDEIQGNILAGFNKDHMWLVGFRITNEAQARTWVREQANKLATTAEVARHNAEYRVAAVQRDAVTPRKSWFNLAFSHAGLVALGVIEEKWSHAFAEGMANRGFFKARADGTAIELLAEPHILAIMASDEPAGLEHFLGSESAIRAHAAAWGLEVAYFRVGENPSGNDHGTEPFGFRDGISQPAVRGTLKTGAILAPRVKWETQTDPRYLDANEPQYARPGQVLVWPGEFVLGYERQSPVHPTEPAPPRAAPAWARNGSFVVYARFAQHVEKFWEHMQQLAGGDDAHLVAARLVGRWRSGAPLMTYPDADPGPDENRDDNHFLFGDDIPAAHVGTRVHGPVAGDPAGTRCPFVSHVRKVNPRDEAGEDEGLIGTLRRRILRRGIRLAGPEAGLLFLSYQASIEDQFEFIWRTWINDELRPAGHGVDALIHEDSPFVELREGGYFFSPAISVIRSVR